jgi:ABC-type glycerol-3-phosphate transport system substrate-binding protein
LTGIRQQPEFWRELASPVPGQVLGAWFKIAHKSLVWHRAGEGLDRPRTLDAWTSRALSIGAADGWVLTDWFENVLLARSPSTYSRLFSQGESSPELWGTGEVSQALELLAAIWQQGMTPERGRRALTLQFHDSILDVFTYRTAEVVAAPDFAWPVIARYRAAGVRAGHFRFPANGGAEPPLVVGGDVAVAMSGGTADAFDFVHWLTSPRPAGGDRSNTQETWAAEGGFLAPYIDASISPPEVRGAARDLAGASTGQYDLSDRLTGPLAGGDGRGLWRILTELFTAVTIDRARPAVAATAAADRLVRAGSRGAR